MKTMRWSAQFICPECGSEEAAAVPCGPTPKSRNVQRRAYRCARCGWDIPAHLAERWGISAEDAKKEWREVYRGVGSVETP